MEPLDYDPAAQDAAVDVLIDVFRRMGVEARYTVIRLVCRRFNEAVADDAYHAMRSAGLGNLGGATDDDPYAPFAW
jgi:hypothetical protein